MLFNSYEFVLYFLPATLAIFFALGWFSRRAACAWLGIASVVFYGYWSPRYIPLLLGSIAGNYLFAELIRNARTHGTTTARSRHLLVAAVAANLAVLGYYKYAGFFVSNIATLLGSAPPALHILLPIGISFFTFTQIAYLVDCYHGKVTDRDPLRYLLFVTFFPHLIAGPILHHAEMMPQFARRATYRFRIDWFFSGLLIFVIGLGKKVVFADGIQPYVAPIFDQGPTFAPTLVQAWGGALAYTLQLYFDFSGYSDMAIGLARMIHVRLPLNFNSPYKATNISDFWRRWHMTLSRFLRDYLYIPLGGNRHGSVRRYANLLTTMLLGGLWHGAAWTFVIWGGLHGLYLCVHHAWDALRERAGWRRRESLLGRITARTVTFVAVVVAWVFFRADSLAGAIRIVRGMSGMNGSGIVLDQETGATMSAALLDAVQASMQDGRQLSWIVILLGIAFLLPNSQTLVPPPGTRAAPARPVRRLLTGGTGFLMPIMLLLLMINASRGVSEFIYFNF